jgi:hypothetical protein
MATSLLDADSFLVVDVGTASTRAMLFDVVDGRYRYLGMGNGPTTAAAPYHSISEGVRMALDNLKSVTGRTLIGPDEQLILPSGSDGSGVDAFAATVSAGPPIKIIVVGLLESMSVESARRLANSVYGKVDYVVSLNDRKKPEERLDAILRLQPDLIIVSGGTEGGASQSVLTLLEAVGLACYLLPVEKRPDVLFVGNQSLQGEINSRIGDLVSLHFAPNVRPALEVEHLDAARAGLARVYGNIRSRQLSGVTELNEWSKNGNVMPTSTAFGRVVQFLSKVHTSNKGVFGIDVGASSLTLAASYNGDMALGVYPQIQTMSYPASTIMDFPIDEIKRWLTVELSDEAITEYLLEKSLYPMSMPSELEDYAIDQALIRQTMNSAVADALRNFPAGMDASKTGLMPWVEPIIATGSALTNTPSLAHSVLTLLDGLQPNGVTTLIVDQYRIASALGAAASSNPLLMIQLLDSNAFLHVGTIIAPIGKARQGTPILRMKVTYDSGHVTDLEVKQGDFDVVPLPQGQSARLQLQPLQRFDIGMGAPGRSGSLRITGGVLGVVIDARGRPLSLPNDIQKRSELYKKWLWTLGVQ